MEEKIGFLKEIGLDYGWGPTSIMQWVLEHVHVYTGLGWGGTIVATALLLRVVMFYPQVRAVKFSAALNESKKDPRFQEAIDLMKKGYQTKNNEMTQKGQFLNKMVRETHGASMTGMFWPFLQIPFSFGLFRIINGMTHIPVPALEDAGFLWFTDLTVADPFYCLPALGTAFLVSSIVVSSTTPTQTRPF
jgi:YidC/Oxa1 family membrane protein insertase